MCVCACARMCLRAWVLERVSSECFGEQEICVDRATENGRKQSSLCFFFSLSPSLLPVGQGLNPNVSWNKTDCSFFLRLTGRTKCRLLRTKLSKTPQNRFFPRRSLKNLSESAMFRNRFHLCTKRVFCFQTLVKRLCVFLSFLFHKDLTTYVTFDAKNQILSQFSTKLRYSLCDCLIATVT